MRKKTKGIFSIPGANLTSRLYDNELIPLIVCFLFSVLTTDADVGRYCGNNVPGLIQSFTRQLIIKFVSDIADQKGGFYASFTTQGNTGVSWPSG